MTQKAGTAVPTGSGQTKAFPPLDPATFAPQLVWLALTFGLLYLLLKRVVLPRVGEVIEQRRERIKGDINQAQKFKADTEAALAEYEQALAEARDKANAMAKAMRDKFTADVDKDRATAEAEIARKLAEAERRIADTKTLALAGVGDIASDVASAIVARLVGKEVSTGEVKRSLTQPAAE